MYSFKILNQQVKHDETIPCAPAPGVKTTRRIVSSKVETSDNTGNSPAIDEVTE